MKMENAGCTEAFEASEFVVFFFGICLAEYKHGPEPHARACKKVVEAMNIKEPVHPLVTEWPAQRTKRPRVSAER